MVSNLVFIFVCCVDFPQLRYKVALRNVDYLYMKFFLNISLAVEKRVVDGLVVDLRY